MRVAAISASQHKHEHKAPKKEIATGDPRSMFYNGQKPFSEPETQAYRDFLTKHQDEVKFVINMHSNGNAFIWPFNGV